MAHWFSRQGWTCFNCGNIRPVGYAVCWTVTSRLGIQYIVYVNGGDLLREKESPQAAASRKNGAENLGSAAGIASYFTIG